MSGGKESSQFQKDKRFPSNDDTLSGGGGTKTASYIVEPGGQI